MSPVELERTHFMLEEDISVLDQEQIEVLLEAVEDTGPEFMDEIISAFRDECGPRLDLIDSEAAGRNDTELRKHIHFIAGSAANTGLLRLSELCRRVESQLDAGTFSHYDDTPTLVRFEFTRGLDEIVKVLPR